MHVVSELTVGQNVQEPRAEQSEHHNQNAHVVELERCDVQAPACALEHPQAHEEGDREHGEIGGKRDFSEDWQVELEKDGFHRTPFCRVQT